MERQREQRTQSLAASGEEFVCIGRGGTQADSKQTSGVDQLTLQTDFSGCYVGSRLKKGHKVGSGNLVRGCSCPPSEG